MTFGTFMSFIFPVTWPRLVNSQLKPLQTCNNIFLKIVGTSHILICFYFSIGTPITAGNMTTPILRSTLGNNVIGGHGEPNADQNGDTLNEITLTSPPLMPTNADADFF